MYLVEFKQVAWQFVDEEFTKGNLQVVDRFVTPDFPCGARGKYFTGKEKFRGEIFN
jgi:hypothetical protein